MDGPVDPLGYGRGLGKQVVVAEGAPALTGHALAADMAALQIPTTLIPDAAIFALMARVNKVCQHKPEVGATNRPHAHQQQTLRDIHSFRFPH